MFRGTMRSSRLTAIAGWLLLLGGTALAAPPAEPRPMSPIVQKSDISDDEREALKAKRKEMRKRKQEQERQRREQSKKARKRS